MNRNSKKIRVAAVQMKFRRELEANIEFIERVVRELAKDGTDAILFPECALTGYNCDFAAVTRSAIETGLTRVSAAARQSGCHVLVGSPTFAGRKRFNSLVGFDRGGREVCCYNKIHLTARDAQFFVPGNTPGFFHLGDVPCAAIICHERRYPELVRLGVMLGAQVVFHPNAGLDILAVSRNKRRGRDGMAVRAFENQVFYVFANSVGPQGEGLWSAGDSKIVAPDSRVLALADNRRAMTVQAELDLTQAGRRYAREALEQPVFLRSAWKAMLASCKRQLRRVSSAQSER
jgi:predicted amidohydrolase